MSSILNARKRHVFDRAILSSDANVASECIEHNYDESNYVVVLQDNEIYAKREDRLRDQCATA